MRTSSTRISVARRQLRGLISCRRQGPGATSHCQWESLVRIADPYRTEYHRVLAGQPRDLRVVREVTHFFLPALFRLVELWPVDLRAATFLELILRAELVLRPVDCFVADCSVAAFRPADLTTFLRLAADDR